MRNLLAHPSSKSASHPPASDIKPNEPGAAAYFEIPLAGIKIAVRTTLSCYSLDNKSPLHSFCLAFLSHAFDYCFRLASFHVLVTFC